MKRVEFLWAYLLIYQLCLASPLNAESDENEIEKLINYCKDPPTSYHQYIHCRYCPNCKSSAEEDRDQEKGSRSKEDGNCDGINHGDYDEEIETESNIDDCDCQECESVVDCEQCIRNSPKRSPKKLMLSGIDWLACRLNDGQKQITSSENDQKSVSSAPCSIKSEGVNVKNVRVSIKEFGGTDPQPSSCSNSKAEKTSDVKQNYCAGSCETSNTEQCPRKAVCPKVDPSSKSCCPKNKCSRVCESSCPCDTASPAEQSCHQGKSLPCPPATCPPPTNSPPTCPPPSCPPSSCPPHRKKSHCKTCPGGHEPKEKKCGSKAPDIFSDTYWDQTDYKQQTDELLARVMRHAGTLYLYISQAAEDYENFRRNCSSRWFVDDQKGKKEEKSECEALPESSDELPAKKFVKPPINEGMETIEMSNRNPVIVEYHTANGTRTIRFK